MEVSWHIGVDGYKSVSCSSFLDYNTLCSVAPLLEELDWVPCESEFEKKIERARVSDEIWSIFAGRFGELEGVIGGGFGEGVCLDRSSCFLERIGDGGVLEPHLFPTHSGDGGRLLACGVVVLSRFFDALSPAWARLYLVVDAQPVPCAIFCVQKTDVRPGLLVMWGNGDRLAFGYRGPLRLRDGIKLVTMRFALSGQEGKMVVRRPDLLFVPVLSDDDFVAKSLWEVRLRRAGMLD